MKLPFADMSPPSWRRSSLFVGRRTSGLAAIGCGLLATIAFSCGSSSAAVQSKVTPAYDAGHTYAAKYAATFRTDLDHFCRKHKVDCPGKETGPITYPASTPQKYCALLMTGDTSFNGNRADWVAGCVSSFKDARFIDPGSISSGATIQLRLAK